MKTIHLVKHFFEMKLSKIYLNVIDDFGTKMTSSTNRIKNENIRNGSS